MNVTTTVRQDTRDGRRSTAGPRGGVLVLDRDGIAHQLRDARAEDGPAIQRLLDNLSPQSAYQRFLTACPRTAAYTASLSEPGRTLDAVVVTAGGNVIALGSTHPLGPGRAEFALAIADDIQGHGLGTLVLEALVDRARRRGVRRLVGDTLFANTQMFDLLRHLGLAYTISVDGGIAEIGIDLVDCREFRRVVTRRKQEARQASLRRRSPQVAGPGPYPVRAGEPSLK